MKLTNELKQTYMEIAEKFANLSCCKRLKVGAIAVKNGTILAHGWNGTPSGYYTNECECKDGLTNPFVLHAEENVIAKLAKSTESIEGASIFCTHSPCPGCAKLLAQMGIKSFYYKEEYRQNIGRECLDILGIHVEQIKLSA
jgi:dCMP deaminase